MALKIAITGASGFIGKHLCEDLLASGHDVRPVVRSGALMPPNGAVIDALDERTDWHEVLFGVDIVIHAAARVHVLYETVSDPVEAFRAVNVKATENLALQAAKAGVKRLVFISSVGVLGNYNKEPFVEGDSPNSSNMYSQSKWDAEQALMSISQQTGLEVVIIRPPLVYGAGVKANFLRIMEAVHEGKWLPFRMVNNKRDFVSIGNLSDFIGLAIHHPNAANQTYLICDEEAVSTPDLVRELAAAMGKHAKMLPVPKWALYLGAKLLGKERLYHSVCSSLRICMNKAHVDLGWKPKESLQEGLKQTVEWFLRQR